MDIARLCVECIYGREDDKIEFLDVFADILGKEKWMPPDRVGNITHSLWRDQRLESAMEKANGLLIID